MKTFPMFLKTTDRRIVICGGGEQAAQKCRLALKTEAEIVLAAHALDPELEGLVAAGRARLHAGPVTTELMAGATLVFVATGCRGADAGLAAVAKAAGALVNVVDAPELCDAFTPSIVDRDPLVVAIGTEGAAPVLARQVKTRVEELLEPRLGELAAFAGRMRSAVAARVAPEKRRAFWRWVFAAAPRRAHAQGRERDAIAMIKQAVETGGAPAERATAPGMVSLVGAGPGSRDLITLRGVQRLQEADVIFYDRLIDPDVLELARRDAERVYVGKTPGAAAWPQDRINALITAEALKGRRVVRLKSGDPGVFGRGAEEAAALDAAKVAWEIVPGVTAAAAAAADVGGFLTARAATDAVVLATGRACDARPDPDWAALTPEGVTLALYMAVAAAPRIQAALLAAGRAPDLEVEIVSRAGAPDARVLRTYLAVMARDIAAEGIENPAIILIRRPHCAAASTSRETVPAIDAPTNVEQARLLA